MSTPTSADRGSDDQPRGTETTRQQPVTPSAERSHDDTRQHPAVTDERPVATDRRSVLTRQREEHGGVKIGSAFFGFLTAVGVAVLLTALVTAAGAAVGLATGTDAADATDATTANPDTVGLVGGIVLLVIVFLAYYAGGYVAGRMARFNGAQQGIAVWVWALVVAAVVAVLGLVAGNQYDILGELNTFPRIPVSEGDLTRGGVVAAVLLVVVSLGGAVVGGLAGMRFHRAVDRTGLPG